MMRIDQEREREKDEEIQRAPKNVIASFIIDLLHFFFVLQMFFWHIEWARAKRHVNFYMRRTVLRNKGKEKTRHYVPKWSVRSFSSLLLYSEDDIPWHLLGVRSNYFFSFTVADEEKGGKEREREKEPKSRYLITLARFHPPTQATGWLY